VQGALRSAFAVESVLSTPPPFYRSETDSVETIATEGTWLGLKDEIGHLLKTKRLHLAEDDVLLLYTGGITEARRDGIMFDTDGVSRILSRAHGKTGEQVLSDLFAGLEGFQLVDDATVVVLKQLVAPRPTHLLREEADQLPH
jgi:serine phosphatase RsbU (regulator of sigma subunit)